MELENTLPCLQQTASGQYIDLIQSTYSETIFLWPIFLYPSPHLTSSPSGLFRPGSPLEILVSFRITGIHATCSIRLVILDFIT
jgi:hypothetical protein